MCSCIFPPPNYRSTPVNALLANALDLSAPASDALLTPRKNAWVQLAGHAGFFAPASPVTIWKRQTVEKNNETNAYKSFQEDAIKSFVPKFYREVVFNGELFIEIEDLLQNFTDPSIMDIKMGTRTFLESEVSNTKLRNDLYLNMMKMDPNEPTAQEHTDQAITKLRYMQFRENQSSSSGLGFRIDAVKMAGKAPLLDWKKIKSVEQVSMAFCKFFNYRRFTCLSVLRRLKDLRKHFEASKFFKSHEVIGSSLLILHDATGRTGVWMIDFAKTTLAPNNKKLTHRSAWEFGNFEDGYLFGLDSLIQTLADISVELTVPSSPVRNDCTLNHV
ncbi:hypothetical protein HELRODRAFT_160789 [Helobdella robusta]|uniref:Kinase n=1 Tax=Helobdella robusta TaxID=6412 RepID=T1EQQ3_HELRO|nr:hypothetical protein HELRODRAFT_160789 [Helobdella robusta]ESO06600.1 hypothetical protein HELRODRAFT_160789 [Helobdella robusta]